MSNVLRVRLRDEMADLLDEVEPGEAYAILNAAADVQVQEQREMTLAEALGIIRRVSDQVEAIG